MNAHMLRLARFVLAAIAIVSAYSGAVLAAQADELLTEPFRFTAALIVGVLSASLFIAFGLLLLGRRSGLFVAVASGAAMIVSIVLGIFQMGEATFYEALQQASCMPGSVLCFDQASTVLQLCVVLLLVSCAWAACKILPGQNTQQRFTGSR